MKSCCSSCKQGKPCCGADMAPGPLSGIFRRGIGYGAYTLGDEPKVAPPVVPAAATPVVVASPDLVFGMSKQTLLYIVGALVIYKILF